MAQPRIVCSSKDVVLLKIETGRYFVIRFEEEDIAEWGFFGHNEVWKASDAYDSMVLRGQQTKGDEQ